METSGLIAENVCAFLTQMHKMTILLLKEKLENVRLFHLDAMMRVYAIIKYTTLKQPL